jgi:hypothetical protein
VQSKLQALQTTHTGVRENPRHPDAGEFCRNMRRSGLLEETGKKAASPYFLHI